MHDLLLPESARPAKFGVGSREYDPEKLGYQTDMGAAPFTFDTAQRGNSNKGHSGAAFGTELSNEERSTLIEFLKTL
jgi:hypothetical protein